MSDMITAEAAEKLLDGTTPGLWRKRDCDVVVGEGLTAKTICHFWRHWSNDEKGIEQTEPNAALTAAAPDLARTVIALHAQLADAKAAQAMVVERAAEAADCGCKSDQSDCLFLSGDVTFCYREGLPDIRALADTDGLALVQALRARAERAERERDAACKVADGYKADFHAALDAAPDNDDLRARLAAAEAQVGALVEAGEQWKAAHIALRDAGTMPEPKFFDMWAERRRKEDALIAALASAQGVKHD